MGFIGAGGLSSGSPIFGGGSPFLPFGPGAGGGGGLMSDPILRAAMAGAYWGGELAAKFQREDDVARLPTVRYLGVLYYMAGILPGRPDVAKVPLFNSGLDKGQLPEDFPGFGMHAALLAPGSAIQLKLPLSVNAGLTSTGTSRLILEGTLAKSLSGTVSFEGFVSGQGEFYNFNQPGLANDLGRLLSGRDFWVEFVGRRAVKFP